MQGGREQQRLVHIRGSKALSHGRILSPNTLWKSCHVWCFRRIYSRQTPRPSALVVAVRETARPDSAAATEESRMTAPLASFTMTCNSEVCTCAMAPASRHAMATSKHKSLRATIMVFPTDRGFCPGSGLRQGRPLRNAGSRTVARPCVGIGGHGPNLSRLLRKTYPDKRPVFIALRGVRASTK